MKGDKKGKLLSGDTEAILYKLSILVILMIGMIYAFQIWFVNYIGRPDLMECRLKALVGISCPGCGGTRALKSLLKIDILSALYYNAFAVYAAVVYIIFFITQTLQRVTKGKIRGVKFKMVYLWIGVAILLVQYALRFIIPGYTI